MCIGILKKGLHMSSFLVTEVYCESVFWHGSYLLHRGYYCKHGSLRIGRFHRDIFPFILLFPVD